MILQPTGPPALLEVLGYKRLRLEEIWEARMVENEPPKACVACFSAEEDLTCFCEKPLIWPINLVLVRMKEMYGST